MRKYVLVLGGLCLLSASVAASPQASAAAPSPAQNPAPQERKDVTVREEVLETYVGEYAVVPGEVLTITLENGSLWGQTTGSTKRQMFAETETKFFLKSSPTEVTFQKDAKGHVIALGLKMGTRPEVTLKKIK